MTVGQGFRVSPMGGRASLRAMVRHAAEFWGIGDYVNDDDVPDPYGQGPEVTEHAFRLMEAAVNTIVRVAHH